MTKDKTPTPLFPPNDSGGAQAVPAFVDPGAAGDEPLPANVNPTPEEANAAAEALLAEADQQGDLSGNISVDELVTAFGAAQLRSDKLQQIVIRQANEIMRLRATLRNVLTAKKK